MLLGGTMADQASIQSRRRLETGELGWTPGLPFDVASRTPSRHVVHNLPFP